MEIENSEKKSRISNIEWGIVIGILLVIDITQVALDWLLAGGGLIINPFIDIFVGMSFAFYLQLRGESLKNPKRAFGLISTFVLEMIPLVDELPLWCLDGLYAMFISKSDKIIKAVSPAGNSAGADTNARS